MAETAVDDAVCIINIGPLQRRRRLRLGLVSLTAGVGVVLAATAAERDALLIPAALLFFGGFSGIFQARAKT